MREKGPRSGKWASSFEKVPCEISCFWNLLDLSIEPRFPMMNINLHTPLQQKK